MKRQINAQEMLIVEFLCENFEVDCPLNLAHLQVTVSDAGGVGAVIFRDTSKISARVLSCTSFDSDGTLLIFDLHLGCDCEIDSLDYWRVDYIPIKNWPHDKNKLTAYPEGSIF